MHHAYYIEGSLSLFEPYTKKLKPFWARSFDRFGVDDARELIEQAQLKSFGEAIFLIAVGSITTEAQQALLKLFEEPQAGIVFVLLTPHGAVIPTLRSRMLPYPDLIEEERGNSDAKKFLKSNQKERSDYIAKLLKDDEGAREAVRELINGLEEELHKSLKKTRGSKAFLESLQDIAQVRSYLGDRSPSMKMLLEHLAIALPQV